MINVLTANDQFSSEPISNEWSDGVAHIVMINADTATRRMTIQIDNKGFGCNLLKPQKYYQNFKLFVFWIYVPYVNGIIVNIQADFLLFPGIILL